LKINIKENNVKNYENKDAESIFEPKQAYLKLGDEFPDVSCLIDVNGLNLKYIYLHELKYDYMVFFYNPIERDIESLSIITNEFEKISKFRNFSIGLNICTIDDHKYLKKFLKNNNNSNIKFCKYYSDYSKKVFCIVYFYNIKICYE
jgi:hypothetical protein